MERESIGSRQRVEILRGLRFHSPVPFGLTRSYGVKGLCFDGTQLKFSVLPA